jgi:general secretion pathway protein C
MAALALVAYLNASAAASLIASNLTVSTPGAPGSPARAGERRTKSAEAILARNPFDSQSRERENLDICAGIRASIVTESSDESWSMATLAGGKVGSRIVRVGDSYDVRKITQVGYDRGSDGPAVWLNDSGRVCRVPLRSPPASETGEAPTGTVEIDRGVVNDLLARRAELSRHLRVVRTGDGRVIGVLRGVDPHSVPFALGFRDGDRVRSVNGFDLTRPEGGLRALAALGGAEHLSFSVERAGRSVTLDLSIR